MQTHITYLKTCQHLYIFMFLIFIFRSLSLRGIFSSGNFVWTKTEGVVVNKYDVPQSRQEPFPTDLALSRPERTSRSMWKHLEVAAPNHRVLRHPRTPPWEGCEPGQRGQRSKTQDGVQASQKQTAASKPDDQRATRERTRVRFTGLWATAWSWLVSMESAVDYSKVLFTTFMINVSNNVNNLKEKQQNFNLEKSIWPIIIYCCSTSDAASCAHQGYRG